MAKPPGPAPTAPPTPGPKPGPNPGYAEPQPRDGRDARQPDPRKPPNPDAGGLGRKPVATPDSADDG